PWPERRDLVRPRDRQKLDEAIGELHDPIVGAPRVAVARPDREAELFIKFARGVEIAHRMHDVIDAARLLERAHAYCTDENAVGLRNSFDARAMIGPSFW